MDKVVSYNEFLKHKDNLETYLKDLFDKIPELNVYFPISLNSEERHLIYTKSKGYLFEKLHKIGSKYSIKLWKPDEDGMNSITEEKNEKDEKDEEEEEDYEKDEDYVTDKEEEEDYEKDEDYVTDKEEEEDYEKDEEEEDYDFKEHLSEISNVLEKQHVMMFNELQRCRRSVNRVECIFTFIMAFNFVGSILFLTQAIDLMVPLPRLNTITDF
jgi:hypothetical protein